MGLLTVLLRQLTRVIVAVTGRGPLPQLGGGAGRGAAPNVSGELVVVHVTAGPLIEGDTDV